VPFKLIFVVLKGKLRRIDVEGPEWKRVVYKRMRTMSESLNGRVKSRLAYSRFTRAQAD